jgi:hypothetical protein
MIEKRISTNSRRDHPLGFSGSWSNVLVDEVEFNKSNVDVERTNSRNFDWTPEIGFASLRVAVDVVEARRNSARLPLHVLQDRRAESKDLVNSRSGWPRSWRRSSHSHPDS